MKLTAKMKTLAGELRFWKLSPRERRAIIAGIEEELRERRNQPEKQARSNAMARTVQVLSSDGQNHYAVQINDKGEAGPCCCKAAQNERKCRHLADAERLDREQTAKETKGRPA